MSKLMSDLNNLSTSRKVQGSIIVEEEPVAQPKDPIVNNHKGIYILSFLVIVLIALSTLSMAASIKTYVQLEESWADSKVILGTLNKQGKDIAFLRSLMTDNNLEELARISALTDQIKEFNSAVKENEKEISEIQTAANLIRNSTQSSIDELKFSDSLILKKVSLLNDKVNDAMKYNSTILSTY